MSNPISKRTKKRLELRALKAQLKLLKGKADRCSVELMRLGNEMARVQQERDEAVSERFRVLKEIAEGENGNSGQGV